MKRLHIHVSVEDLTASIRFYSALFASRPTFREVHVASADEPQTDASACYISTHGKPIGVPVDSSSSC
ncbi:MULTISPECIES: hypothetical protein [Burkholderia]|uniref:hypothetical protein n=1 Tax=Burkholderia TaxID=32008 RepID=UPI0018D44CB7|nr:MULTISPECIES: hypothetical protein [Burkholderia]MBR7913763.1 hypothetical protein [Burkholderia vietnamiensis]MBU9146359.1 hypothetical protein [Burkholderia multivorans]MBU9540488.1 hypothetical protein [Burkholderia multivorans]MBU9639496.1 hypothetical protein [Burkholderia multivorans]HDR9069021.1 hypothetical protein [Burkholderia vietnamiensis]